MIFSSQKRRRLVWRAGRYLYCRARNETTINNISTNGETYVQACVLNGAKFTEKTPFTIFDVGANLGEWTSHLIGQVPENYTGSLNLHLFEPIPATFKKLTSNLSRFDENHSIDYHPLAMSNEIGESEMLIMSDTGGTNTLSFDKQFSSKAINRTVIQKSTLDIFCQDNNVDHIHLLKCDTEGHDAYVLAGANNLLKSERVDVVQFEYNHRWVYARSYLKDVFDIIEDLPYRLGRVCKDHIEVFDGWHFEMERYFESNFVIIHDSVVNWFDINYGKFDKSNTYA